jgi:hypothetical protein
MAIRIQLRRDTAANWVSANPTLRAGEFGIETDTLKFKIGDGTSTWTQISNYANVTPSSLDSSLGDYIALGDQGTPGGPAELNFSGNLIVPEDSVILWNDAAYDYTTTLTATQPTADRTITFPDASGTLALTSDVPQITITQVDAEGTATETYSGISTIAFDEDSGFDVTSPSTGVAKIAMNSTFKFWEVDGVQKLTATGLDTVNFISGSGVDISASGSSDPQSITIAIDDTVTVNSATQTLTNKTIQDPTFTGDLTLDGSGDFTISSDSNIVLDPNTTAYLNSATSGNEIATEGYVDAIETALESQINNKLSLSGGTLTGSLTLSGDPSASLHAVTKQYVDNTASGIVAKPQVLGATTANIDATYNNGTAGVGATLTHNTNGVFPAEAGGASGWAVGKGILVKNQTNKEENGRYFVSDMGSVSTPYVLTRCSFCDEASEIPGAYIYVQAGTSAGTGWIQVVADPATFTVGTDDIDVYQFSGSGTYTAGTGLTLNGNEYSINTSVTADLSTAQTLTNKTLTSPKINEDVAVTATATEINVLDGITSTTAELNILDGVTSTAAELNILDGVTATTVELNYVDGVTSAIQTQLDTKADADSPTISGTLVLDGTGDFTISSDTAIVFDATVIEISAGAGDFTISADDSIILDATQGVYIGSDSAGNEIATEGYVDTAISNIDALPSQSGNSGKYLTTDGSSASWASLVVPIQTGTYTLTQDTAATIDLNAMADFTSIEYMISLKQGSKVRTSKVILQTDGSSVDITEYAITETGGSMSGVVISGTTSGTNSILQATVTNASSANVNIKFSKVRL